jgi:hypothetical protein
MLISGLLFISSISGRIPLVGSLFDPLYWLATYIGVYVVPVLWLVIFLWANKQRQKRPKRSK